jgi:putative redox protein
MATVVTGRYQGSKRVSVKHEESGAEFQTDAPKDNTGLGESFSPTDLVGTALGSCVLTTMAIVAERDGLDFKTASFRVQKEMSTTSPRRISRLLLEISLPDLLSPEARTKYERVAHSCPVHHSLHPDTKIDIVFRYSAS